MKNSFLGLRTIVAGATPRMLSINKRLLFSIRVTLGSLFLTAGFTKLFQQPDFLSPFSSYFPLLQGYGQLIGQALPVAEILVGLCLLLNLLSRLTAVAALMLVTGFISANAWALYQNTQGNCNCFGGFVPLNHIQSLVIDTGMLLIALTLIVAHPRRINFGTVLRRAAEGYRFISVPLCLVVLASLVPSAVSAHRDESADISPAYSTQISEITSSPDVPVSKDDAPPLPGKPSLVYFYTEACGFCQQQKPVIADMEKVYGEQVSFVSIDAASNRDTVERLDVTGFPTILLMDGKEGSTRLTGYQSAEALSSQLDSLLRRVSRRNTIVAPTTGAETPPGATRALDSSYFNVTADDGMRIFYYDYIIKRRIDLLVDLQLAVNEAWPSGAPANFNYKIIRKQCTVDPVTLQCSSGWSTEADLFTGFGYGKKVLSDTSIQDNVSYWYEIRLYEPSGYLRWSHNDIMSDWKKVNGIGGIIWEDTTFSGEILASQVDLNILQDVTVTFSRGTALRAPFAFNLDQRASLLVDNVTFAPPVSAAFGGYIYPASNLSIKESLFTNVTELSIKPQGTGSASVNLESNLFSNKLFVGYLEYAPQGGNVKLLNNRARDIMVRWIPYDGSSVNITGNTGISAITLGAGESVSSNYTFNVAVRNNHFIGRADQIEEVQPYISVFGQLGTRWTFNIEQNDGYFRTSLVTTGATDNVNTAPAANRFVRNNRQMGYLTLSGLSGVLVEGNEIMGNGTNSNYLGSAVPGALGLQSIRNSIFTRNQIISLVPGHLQPQQRDAMGIGIFDSSNNTLTENTVRHYKQGIFWISDSRNNIIHSNRIEENYYNIYDASWWVGSRSDNRIYNNIFRKPTSRNIYASRNHALNIWNTDKTAGTNIINGRFMGGNHWDDYTGADADRDGIGDTPHVIDANNADNFPLVSTIIVNVATDERDADTGDGKCDINLTVDGEQCTLRAAIEESNARSSTDTILFNIPGGGVPVIRPQTVLPTVTDSVNIDATSQPGGRVKLDGEDRTFSGLYITAGMSTVKGFIITRFGGGQYEGVHGHGILIESSGSNRIEGNIIGTDAAGESGNRGEGIYINGSPGNTVKGNIISSNRESGIRIKGSAATGNRVEDNNIGTDAAGTTARGNYIGVYIDGAPGNTIGGTTSGTANVISGNTNVGVYITGAAASGNSLQGNFIGTTRDGMVALGNGDAGVEINAPSNTVGGNYSDSNRVRNIISGNQVGVRLTDPTATGNRVQGNYIGIKVNGAQPLPNVAEGVLIVVGAVNNTIGGTAEGERNIISGNGADGIKIEGDGAQPTGNRVQGNYIGTSWNGWNPVPNTRDGVRVRLAGGNTIGGSETGARNIISGNLEHGVEIIEQLFGDYTRNNTIEGNYIGTTINGDYAMGNTMVGVRIVRGSSNTVRGNVISASGSHGVEITGDSDTMLNQVLGNLIGTNAEGTEALFNKGDGVHIGYNQSSSVPISNNIIGGLAPGQGNVITGNEGDGVEIVGSGARGNQVLGNYIGLDKAGTGMVSGGNAQMFGGQDSGVFTEVSNLGEGVYINNAPQNIIAGNVISLNKLRGVYITGSSATGNTVKGNLIGTDKDALRIKEPRYNFPIGNILSGVLVVSGGNTIGGTLLMDGNYIGGNGEAGVALVGAAATGNRVMGNMIGINKNGNAIGNLWSGLHIENAPGNTIGGPTVDHKNTISGNKRHGILVTGSPSASNLFQHNLVGTDSDGIAAVPNEQNGLMVQDAPNNVLGGRRAGEGNLIAGNKGHGVEIVGTTATGNRLEGNIIGASFPGEALGNQGDGVFLNGVSNNTIGGSDAGNLISGNKANGLRLGGATATGNQVQGNRIGTNAASSAAVPNLGNGILLEAGANNNIIGGTVPAAGNTVSGNVINGIELNGSGTTNNQVQGNFIGTQRDRTTRLANTVNGVLVTDGAIGNLIGGMTVAAGNVIAFNGADGVFVAASNRIGILGNSIYGNASLGIDLGQSGVTPNDTGDPDTGANALQNFPVLTSADSRGTTVQGTLNSSANATFRIEFFSNVQGDESGYGEGQRFLGFTTVNTDATGNASFTAELSPSVLQGHFITATATDANNNTSEFSACVSPTGGVSGSADLAIQKSASPSAATLGNNITYTVTVTNNGPTDATQVRVTDILSARTVFVSAAASQGSYTQVGDNVTWNPGNLASGASANITIGVAVTSIGTITNIASVTAAEPDPTPANNTTSVTVTPPPADLSVTKTDLPDPVTAGRVLTYTANVTNNGPGNATSVVLTDTLPGSVYFKSSTPSQGSCSQAGGNVTCNLGNVASGASANVTIAVVPLTSDNITNTASVAATEPDPNPANNTVTCMTTVSPGSGADLAITKTDFPDPVWVGDNLTYNITVVNYGPDDATFVSASDSLSSRVSLISATPGQGTCSGTSWVSCSLGTLAKGASTNITIVVVVNSSGTINNVASVAGGVTDPDNTNNSAVISTSAVYRYMLTMAVNGSGTTSPPSGVYSYLYGTVVSISAMPAIGWQFVNWTGSVASATLANTTVTMNGYRTVTANFALQPTPTPTPTPTPGPLAVSTDNATNVSGRSARLNGTLTSLGTNTTAQLSFEWGTSTNYTGETASITTNAAGPFSIYLTGLSENTTYHLRAKAVGDGTAYGANVTLTTRLFDIMRDLPNFASRGQTFQVTVNFTAPSGDFSSLYISDFVPVSWNITANKAWCTPAADQSKITGNRIDYLWYSSPTGYPRGTAFAAVYQVTVPLAAAPGIYTFTSGYVEYYTGTGQGPFTAGVGGDYQIEVVEGGRIEGVTFEAKGLVLGGVTVTLDGITSVVSDGNGFYQVTVTATGSHTLVASKTGFRSATRTVNVTDIAATYTVDFKGIHGLVPNRPDLSYVLACINRWKFPPTDGTGPDLSKVLGIINAWKFPV